MVRFSKGESQGLAVVGNIEGVRTWGSPWMWDRPKEKYGQAAQRDANTSSFWRRDHSPNPLLECYHAVLEYLRQFHGPSLPKHAKEAAFLQSEGRRVQYSSFLKPMEGQMILDTLGERLLFLAERHFWHGMPSGLSVVYIMAKCRKSDGEQV